MSNWQRFWVKRVKGATLDFDSSYDVTFHTDHFSLKGRWRNSYVTASKSRCTLKIGLKYHFFPFFWEIEGEREKSEKCNRFLFWFWSRKSFPKIFPFLSFLNSKIVSNWHDFWVKRVKGVTLDFKCAYDVTFDADHFLLKGRWRNYYVTASKSRFTLKMGSKYHFFPFFTN